MGSEDEKETPPGEPLQAPDSREEVDVTLIRWMLSLTPAERLAVLQDQAQAILELRGKL